MGERLLVRIRDARPEDTPQVIAFTRRIWGGHDYVPDVWEEWLDDPSGRSVVAHLEDKVVGVARISALSPQDWWLHGLRVHPDYEGQGIASQLHEALVAEWEITGAGSLRLATNTQRLPVHHLCERTGFTRLGEYTYFQAPALDEPARGFSAVRLTELNQAAEHARYSPINYLTHGLWDRGWEWLAPQAVLFTGPVMAGLALWWKGRTGLLLLGKDDDEQPGVVIAMIQLIACPLERLADLLTDLRRLAPSLSCGELGWTAPYHPDLLPILVACGFERGWDDSIYLYEKKHPKQM